LLRPDVKAVQNRVQGLSTLRPIPARLKHSSSVKTKTRAATTQRGTFLSFLYFLSFPYFLSSPYANPNDANAVIDAHPSATPNTAPASTSLKKCIPKTMRDTAMLIAMKNSGASSPG